jgi:KDO2-lipid IV(A) lauroyltransferase
VLSRLLVAVLWLLHFLPLSVLAACGSALGSAFFVLARRRQHIVPGQSRPVLPELDDEQRRLLAKAHFRVLGRSVLERSLLLWASQERLSRLIRVEGEERMRTLLAAGPAGADADAALRRTRRRRRRDCHALRQREHLR